MTGFARSHGEADWGSWVWEGKSVNGKGLDVRLVAPTGAEEVEKRMRKAIAARFSRGNFQISLRLELSAADAGLTVNMAALKSLMDAYEQADGALATGPALATLMGVKGVIEAGSNSEMRREVIEGAVDPLVKSGEEMLAALAANRDAEGEALSELLFGHLNEIERLSADAVMFAADQKESIATKYRERIAEFDSEGAVSDDRLATEVAVLSAKADVSEELDRLTAHVQAGRELLASDSAVGRNLGFLAQELNREANTLCSKSASLDLTNAGLALKAVIDQFKEQAANVE
ncbi:MAG: YicC/YloC family endoribonuclease [Henriciella sp.]|nr:YicC/YloC family endoribonuclease [Henriciella sp.]